MKVVARLTGNRLIVAERDASVLVYSLFEPATSGRFSVLREVDGAIMGRTDTRRRDTAKPFNYDVALEYELAQRRHAEEQILEHCPELQYLDQRKRTAGVFRARGQVRFIGDRDFCARAALLQQRSVSESATVAQPAEQAAS